MSERPRVSVIVPFGGSDQDAVEMCANLTDLLLGPGDELLIADNTPEQRLQRATLPRAAKLVPANGQRSAYSARNIAATEAQGEWLLFTDADCRPAPDLIDRYLSPTPAERTALVVGEVRPVVRDQTFVSEYQFTRSQDEQATHMANPFRPFGVTGNLLVRRAAFDVVGGFQESVRSGGDADLCWRIQAAGWDIEAREDAWIDHRQRDTLRKLIRQHARYGAGGRWLSHRHPDSGYARPTAPRIARALASATVKLVRGQPRDAAFRALDAVVVSAEGVGRLMANRTPAPEVDASAGGRRVALLVDSYPHVSETFISAEARALAELGVRVRIEAIGRPDRPDPGARGRLDVRYLEDDGLFDRARDLAWLLRRNPAGCLRDLLARRRYMREEWPLPLRSIAPLARRVDTLGDEHLHAHFGAAGALNALRLSRLLGRPYSVTLHGYDMFLTPMNLGEKIREASFATSGSDYTVGYLRREFPEAADRIHKIVMGVDGRQWTRTTTPGAGNHVVAVGRLVEKKGFADLLRAAALLNGDHADAQVLIVGDGPLREELHALQVELGLEERVSFLGARVPTEVRQLLESAAVVAIPCVIAADGDRDSMPVIAKEALAMEVPVVGTDVAGLPEAVREPWGRLVPPHNPPALAAALANVLGADAAQRAAMGAAGREFVVTQCDVVAETRKLIKLIDEAVER